MIRLMILTVAFAVTLTAAEPPSKLVAPSHPQFERMKKLEGTWVEADKDGKPTDKVFAVYKLIAGGSVLEETTFPGQPMEMKSLYHMDKTDFVMTHYCVLGNQPRMKADPKSATNTIHWQFAGGTNLDPAKDMHMHEATIKFLGDDSYEMSGVAWNEGKPADDHCGKMTLIRKK